MNHLAVSGDRTVFAYATYGRIHVGSATVRVEDGISAIALSDDGTAIAIATSSTPPRLEVRTVASGDVRWSVELERVASHLAWRGDLVLYAPTAVLATSRHASDGTIAPSVGGAPSGVSAIALGPDGTFAAVGTEEGTVLVQHMAGGPILGSHIDHHGPITSVAFSPDGREVASASADGTVLVWTVPTE